MKCNVTKTFNPSENKPKHQQQKKKKPSLHLSIISFSLLDKIYALDKLRQLTIYKCGSP